MAAHNEMGRWGEDQAVAYLEQQGYTILERDWHSGHRDIDIIALHDGMLVFVEVKTRQNRTFTDPEQAVDYRKLHNLRAAINHYLKYCRLYAELRMDIITVVGTIGSEPEIQHIKDIPMM